MNDISDSFGDVQIMQNCVCVYPKGTLSKIIGGSLESPLWLIGCF